MKLARFQHGLSIRIGAVDRGEVVDLGQALPGLPDEMEAFLAAGWAVSPLVSRAIASGEHRLPLDSVSLEAPVRSPQKFLGVGLNYQDHIIETGRERPEFPLIFNKQSSCVIGPGRPIQRPRASPMLDYEGEMAFVIGRRCRHVPRERAAEVIAGYTIVNDVSVRDWQRRSPTMTLGKSWDTHGPMGPWIVTPDEIGDPHDLPISTWVNDERRQRSNTRHLIFDCFELVATLSTVFTLEPGDVVATGTPSGVGVGMDPPKWLAPGDVVRIVIHGIGELVNPVTDEPEPPLDVDPASAGRPG